MLNRHVTSIDCHGLHAHAGHYSEWLVYVRGTICANFTNS